MLAARMDEVIVPDSSATMGIPGLVDESVIREAMGRVAQHDPERLNIVAHAVTDVLGFTVFSRRYAIAVLVLERLSASASTEAGA